MGVEQCLAWFALRVCLAPQHVHGPLVVGGQSGLARVRLARGEGSGR